MQTEVYMRRDVAAPNVDEGLADQTLRHLMLRQLDFEHLLKFETDDKFKLEAAALLFPELTGKELTTWRRFLPTVMSMQQYSFDEPPTEALEVIHDAKVLGYFHRIEIWTPRGNTLRGYLRRSLDDAIDAIDPMAVGVITDLTGIEHYFPIVRWGESLLPLNKIEAHVRRVRMSMLMLTKMIPLIVATVIVSALVVAMLTFGVFSVIMLGGAAILVCLFVAVIIGEHL